MATNTETTLFHMLAGAFIAGKTLIDYCDEFSEALPTHNKDGLPIKGNKSLKVFSYETSIKVGKLMTMFETFLKHDGMALNLTIEEINRVEKLISMILMLSPNSQNRVQGLIDKLSIEDGEVDFLNSLENDGTR